MSEAEVPKVAVQASPNKGDLPAVPEATNAEHSSVRLNGKKNGRYPPTYEILAPQAPPAYEILAPQAPPVHEILAPRAPPAHISVAGSKPREASYEPSFADPSRLRRVAPLLSVAPPRSSQNWTPRPRFGGSTLTAPYATDVDDDKTLQHEFIAAAQQLSKPELREFVLEHVKGELSKIRLMPTRERALAFRALCLEWHPDKCPAINDIATDVFQYLQTQKSNLLHQGRKN